MCDTSEEIPGAVASLQEIIDRIDRQKVVAHDLKAIQLVAVN